MRRVARYTLHVLTAILLLMCAVTVALWARNMHLSLWHRWPYPPIPSHVYQTDEVTFWSQDGVGNLAIGTVPLDSYYASVADRGWWSLELRDGLPGAARYTYIEATPRYHRAAYNTVRDDLIHARFWFVAVPLWIPLLLFLLLSAGMLKRYAGGRNKAKAGFCHACGYDLRATPGRCPECGTKAEKIENASN